MARALVTLIGFATAGLVLYAVPDVTRFTDHPDWGVPALWALAGFVGLAAYRAGSLRGLSARLDVPVLVLVFLPWTLVAIAVIAHVTGEPSTIASHARDLTSRRVLDRLADSAGPLAFGAGALLALGLIGPRARTIVRETVAPRDDVAPEPADEVAPTVEPVDERLARRGA
jgi:hypothetical protein